MTPLSRRRRDAERFARLVDRAAGPRPPATDAVRPEPPDLLQLDRLARRLRHQPDPPADPRFAADLREQLLAAADQVVLTDPAADPVPALPVRPRSRARRRLSALVATVALVTGSAGVAVASDTALPGEALYPVKRGLETLRVATQGGEAAKGTRHLDIAGVRLAELRELVERGSGDPGQIDRVLADFRSSATRGAELIVDAATSSGDETGLTGIRSFTTAGMDDLSALAAATPEQNRDALSAAAATLATIDGEVTTLCPRCDAPLAEIPALLLQSAAALGDLLDLAETFAAPAPEPMSAPAGAQRLATTVQELARKFPTPTADPAEVDGDQDAPVAAPRRKADAGTTSSPARSSPRGTAVKDRARQGSQALSGGAGAIAGAIDQLTLGASGPLTTVIVDAIDKLVDTFLGPDAGAAGEGHQELRQQAKQAKKQLRKLRQTLG